MTFLNRSAMKALFMLMSSTKSKNSLKFQTKLLVIDSWILVICDERSPHQYVHNWNFVFVQLIHNTLDPFFSISHPTAIQASLFAGATLAKFDTSGRFVAAARPTGDVEVWDLETRSPIRSLDGHVKAITSIEWVSFFLDKSYCDGICVVGPEILDMFWVLPRTGTCSYGTWQWHAIHHNVMHPSDSTTRLSVLPSTQRIGINFFICINSV